MIARRRSAAVRPRPIALVAGLALAAVLGAAAAPLAAQEAAWDRGLVGAGLGLRGLDGVKRVLLVGAHPDDEDTSLLAALARGMGAETAYLSLTRGDGGQNLIGPELGEGLGLVRTGELLSARALDGGRQYFTRAFDYGFSKSAEEAFATWPREELLRDVVWVIRSFRPQVIVSIFSGTPRDGHGQHQAAGILAREGFEAAADPSRFPDQLREGVTAWQATKLFQRSRGTPEDVTVETGAFDPLLGRSWFQLAMESRSRHRSQDMGVPRPFGPRGSALTLVAAAPSAGPGAARDFFAGVDTSFAAVAAASTPAPRWAPVRRAVEAYRAAVADAVDALDVRSPGAAVPPLARALAGLDRIEAAAGPSPAPPGGVPVHAPLSAVLEGRRAAVREALLDAAGVVSRTTVARDLLAPGEPVEVTVELWNGGPFTLRRPEAGLELPDGWSADRLGPGEDGEAGFFGRSAPPVDPDAGLVPPGRVAVWRWRVDVPADAALSRPYFLERPREGELYRWPDDPALRALPLGPPVLHGRVRMVVAAAGEAAEVTVRRPGRYLGVDKAAGEFTRPVLVVPAVSVATEPAGMVWPVGLRESREVTVRLRGLAEEGRSGRVRLEAPGWTVEPEAASFSFEGAGEDRSLTFRLAPAPGLEPGRHRVRAVATTARGERFDEGFVLVDHPHIEPVARFADAATAVTVVPVRVAEGLRVGYVMGSGDDGPEALRQMGVAVELLGPERVRAGDFAGYDALVLGIRAYETRPDLAAANARVLDFAREGGTVVVQYNKYEYPAGDFAPFPVAMARPHDRVTDEDSPVTFVDPDSPVLNVPNRIGPGDFEGWVTERGLYFLHEWDDAYRPVLALTDPGEDPKLGSILVAPLGDGLYVYTGLSFFRQLPAGVPGAYRLFANLVSLDADTWRRAAPEDGR